MRITSKGQVTIPRDVRQKAGLLPHTEVEFVFEGKKVVLQPSKKGMTRGEAMVAHMRGKGTGKLTTDQIMALTRGE